jgi:exosortase
MAQLNQLELRCPGIVRALPLLLFGVLLWGQLAIALSPWWRDGSYYDYGWLVPFLAIWCLWARWERLPVQVRTLQDSAVPASQMALVAIAVIALAMLRLVERSDPAWRIPVWLHALTVMALWHGVVLKLTGRFLYFLPVTILMLTAVPLPPVLESALIHRLTQAVLDYSVPIANLMGIPVAMTGSALTAHGELLQIDDGCSGIRSFQSLLMISIFFGEFFFLSWPKRLLMVVTGFASAFLFNGLRTLTLTWIFFKHGESRFHEFHDGVGVVTFVLSAIATYLVAWWMAGPVRRTEPCPA